MEIDFKVLEQCIVNGDFGVKEIDNGYGRGQWDKEDFTQEEKEQIADGIIEEYIELIKVSKNDTI